MAGTPRPRLVALSRNAIISLVPEPKTALHRAFANFTFELCLGGRRHVYPHRASRYGLSQADAMRAGIAALSVAILAAGTATAEDQASTEFFKTSTPDQSAQRVPAHCRCRIIDRRGLSAQARSTSRALRSLVSNRLRVPVYVKRRAVIAVWTSRMAAQMPPERCACSC